MHTGMKAWLVAAVLVLGCSAMDSLDSVDDVNSDESALLQGEEAGEDTGEPRPMPEPPEDGGDEDFCPL